MRYQTDKDSPLQLFAVEINITEKCNLNCKGCDHAMGIIKQRHIPVSEIICDLATASKIIHARTLRVIGGEPLLHPSLLSILSQIKDLSIADSVELWTNGILLNRLPESIWKTIDGVIISRYPEVELNWDISLLQEFSNKHSVWFYIRDCSHFKWSNTITRIKDLSLAKILHANCRESVSCHTIRNGKFYKCVQSAFSYDRLLASGIKTYDDGVQINGRPEKVKKKIINHLWSRSPLNACYYCLGEFGKSFSHENLSHNNVDQVKDMEVKFDPHFIIPK